MKKKRIIIILISLLLIVCMAALVWFFNTNRWINYHLLHRSTSPDVTIGSDGWLFFNDTLADYRKDNLYTQEDLERFVRMCFTPKTILQSKVSISSYSSALTRPPFMVSICPGILKHSLVHPGQSSW